MLMKEIEKIYENANIKICKHKQGFTLKDCTDRDCKECGYYAMPPFTAEKQIKLFLFVTSLGVCEIEDWKEKGFHFAIKRKNIYPTTFLSLSNINFEETLADIINNLWQDLTEEEKQQIKEILE